MATGLIPPPDPDPYAELSDEQLLESMKGALRLVMHYRVGSVYRADQWTAYNEAKSELDRRLFNHVLEKLGEKEQTP